MRIFRFVMLFLLVATQALAAQVRVSDTDYRDYRALTLDSGLTVLLVHDERASKAAAALALPVGSLDDPDSQPGLAHYLEHMLFLGSESYPGAEEYQSFITRNGGQTNAATGYTSTTYMMEVDPPAFPEALRRMADTLARPLLDPVYADKERNAVNAEMESKKHSDGRRIAMLTLSTLNPAHPATRFTGGNLETLSDKPGSRLHDELVRFHHTWYSANLMKGVLYGPQSLDELERLARSELGVIPDRGAQVREPSVPPVTDAERGVVFGVRPVRETRSMTIDFVLPQKFDNPSTKPLQVAAAVLGTETDNSLVANLRGRGLVLGLSAGGDTTSLRNGVTMSLFLQLTEDGDRRRDEILATVFSYLDMLRSRGIGQEYVDQLGNMMSMEFRFAPLTSGFDYVAEAAGTMLRHPVEDVNYGPYRLDSYDAAAVRELVGMLTPANARIFHVGPDQPTDREAFFYQTPYSVRPVAAADTARWAELGQGMKLALPDLNPFVPDDFSLVHRDGGKGPRKLADRPGLTVWQGQSQFRREPRAILMTRLQSAHIAGTLEQTAMQGVLLELWDQKQAGLRYQAQEAGLNLSVSGDEGVLIRIDGFSQHQADLLPRVLGFLNQEVTADEFELARTEQLRSLANMEKQRLFGQAMGAMRGLLKVPSWDHRAMEEATRGVTLDGLKAYMAAMRRDLRFTVFGFGNVTQDDVLAVADSVAPFIGPEAGEPGEAARILPVRGVVADYRRDSVLEDSALVEMFLDPAVGPESRARMLLLEGLLSTRFYSRLRTEEQLGYVATSFPVMFAHGAGIGFGVQSPVAGTADLADRFESFYFKALSQLRGVTDEEFESVRQGVLASLTKTPDTLDEEFGWYETDLRLGNAAFDGLERLVAAVEKAKLREVVRAYETLVLGPGGTRVLVQIQGSRFRDLGWADKKGAVQTPRFEEFHRVMGAQRYRGL
ncbi:pitrilysin [Desulfomicrobium escambiense]|uniref:pitrilysin n=1 Tax=Desulfomicrobium escambiense TaxID=29503 RepID=UPI00040449F1|nr:pitrilysin [Desulfomicrobium escambiense]